ncbi:MULTISPECIES: 3-phenylpropionate MFS transporter [Brenneria]|uniref:3-phenylpropionate MFS transporter n=1 Tax=Brenneria nigrifluens DSM 30175 = ATCC 13028 TaxID=1121120 RepID=A0A2U1UNF7_9GAMM|nr:MULTISPECIES: 3-phenylpropionate MFS transporter [Brenneria]EHD20564.1 major facilitator superfamily MFS_1 [Brenneria sp. EniD312]PWC23151.1 3-phenylpropionate MFS transporter [Brenneria nigrifluens DSM 30175 = ATCC 13028]QCR03749.1 3-phenylpropionate MFS transporter [Brenneria nigrifluens DSM 30175 = ATCC 13028]
MVLHSTRWLALSYFTYFFCYGIFLPFWGGWLKGEGLSAESIGVLLGAGLVARCVGSLVITPCVKDPSKLILALRMLGLLTLGLSVGFWLGNAWLWLLLVMIGFNLFFAPLVPLTDALAAIWQRQIAMDYGKVRVWGSIAFVIGSAVTGELVSVWGHPAILAILSAGLVAMFLGMLFRPSVMPEAAVSATQSTVVTPWKPLLREPAVWRFLLCVSLLQGAHAAYYGFSVIYWQDAGYSASIIGYLWSLGVAAEIVIFTFSQRLFRRWSARDLLLLSALCGVVRWGMMGSTVALPWLIVIQILHCGTFTVCHLAAMRFIAARSGGDVLRLQAVYSALAMGGGIALMTVVSGFLFEHSPNGTFWVMAMLAVPALFVRPSVSGRAARKA